MNGDEPPESSEMLVQSKNYLSVPEDSEKLMLTPPLGPCDPPSFWSKENPEDAPYPELLTPFDLNAPEGMVSVGGGEYMEVEESKGILKMEGEKHGFKVTRRKIIKYQESPLVVIDLYEDNIK